MRVLGGAILPVGLGIQRKQIDTKVPTFLEPYESTQFALRITRYQRFGGFEVQIY